MAEEPFTSEPKDVAAKRAAEFRLLVKSYKATFANEHGRRVLADLKKKFGFDTCEADSEGTSDNIIARRTFMKRPIFHIEKMRTHNFEKPPKRSRAIS